MKRVGVFICHCGVNIAGTIDVKRVVAETSAFAEVAYATDYSTCAQTRGKRCSPTPSSENSWMP